jgi:hypothetical protein
MVPPPYSQHLGAPLFGSTWTIEAEPPLPQAALDRVWRSYYMLPWWNTWENKTTTVAQIKTQLEQNFHVKVKRITLARTSFQVLPFPAKRVAERQSAIACVYENDRFQGLDAMTGFDPRAKKHYIEVKAHGFTKPQYRFGYYLNHSEALEMLDVERVGNRYYYAKPRPGIYSLCALVKDPTLGEREVIFDSYLQY